MKKVAFIIALALVLSLFAIPASAEKLVFEGEGETIADTFDLPKTDTPIVIDGKLDEAYGDPIWIVKGASRYTDPDAFAIHPPTDYSDDVLAVGSAVDSWFYFRWDAEYLYLCAQTTKQFTTDALSKQDPWKAGTDCIQVSIVPEDTSNGEIGFSIVSPEDLSEAWVWFFNNMATGSGDIAEEASPAFVTFENGLTTWEIAISWTDALCTVPAEGDKYSVGIAFFFGTDVIGSMGYQVGRYVFNNGRDLALNPVATLTGIVEEVAPVEEEVVEVEEETTTTTEITTTTETTTTANPTTSDISVIYYALTALAAAGFVFTKKR